MIGPTLKPAGKISRGGHPRITSGNVIVRSSSRGNLGTGEILDLSSGVDLRVRDGRHSDNQMECSSSAAIPGVTFTSMSVRGPACPGVGAHKLWVVPRSGKLYSEPEPCFRVRHTRRVQPMRFHPLLRDSWEGFLFHRPRGGCCAVSTSGVGRRRKRGGIYLVR